MTISIVRPRADRPAAGGRLSSSELPGDPWPWVWNYFTDGKDNYEADRVFAHALHAKIPHIADTAAERLTARRRLVVEAARVHRGEQLLVLCADFPVPARSSGPHRLLLCDEDRAEVHVIARELAPAARTLYVSPDPMVAAHARALFSRSPGSACIVAAPDDPATILNGASRALDLSRPVAVVMIGALEHLHDAAVSAVVGEFGRRLAPGSHLGVVHLIGAPQAAVALDAVCATHQVPAPRLRSPGEVAALLGRDEMTGLGGRDLRGQDDIAAWWATTPIGGGT